MSEGPGPWRKGPQSNFPATNFNRNHNFAEVSRMPSVSSPLQKLVTVYEGKSKPTAYH